MWQIRVEVAPAGRGVLGPVRASVDVHVDAPDNASADGVRDVVREASDCGRELAEALGIALSEDERRVQEAGA